MTSVEELLAGRPPEVAALCRDVIGAVERAGSVELEVLPKQVVFHGARRIFGSLRPGRTSISVHLNLVHPVDDPRLTSREPLTKRLFFHRFTLSSPADLDGRFEAWIREAYRVGQGDYAGD